MITHHKLAQTIRCSRRYLVPNSCPNSVHSWACNCWWSMWIWPPHMLVPACVYTFPHSPQCGSKYSTRHITADQPSLYWCYKKISWKRHLEWTFICAHGRIGHNHGHDLIGGQRDDLTGQQAIVQHRIWIRWNLHSIIAVCIVICNLPNSHITHGMAVFCDTILPFEKICT